MFGSRRERRLREKLAEAYEAGWRDAMLLYRMKINDECWSHPTWRVWMDHNEHLRRAGPDRRLMDRALLMLDA